NMPRKIKQEEGYIPLDAGDVKHALEIPVKNIDRKSLTKIEKQGKKPAPKKYTLIITEKPQAAEKIASALGNARRYSELGVSYYELERERKKIIVACAVGHLFNLAQKEKKSDWPVFDLKWEPTYTRKGNEWSKKYYSLLVKLCKNASDFIIATDYDIEGEVIGFNIVRFICKQKDAKRMKFSTLTSDELKNSYDNLEPTINWGQAIAGETRHHLDWLYGINLSRALMEAVKKAGSFKIMSIGRVQGPSLNLIVDKELAIKNFKPSQYWQIFIFVDGIELKHNKDITDKNQLDKFKDLNGKEGEAKTLISEQRIKPPAPFDLTTLQTESYRFFGITPSRTLQIAQNLYLAGLISYPRTS
ncbi:MAG: DNA topoisomerase, partial [Nanoarchaeota archaeon]